MTERTPMGGDYRFTYGRIVSPETAVRIGGNLVSELEAEYSADFNGQGWGQPAVMMLDAQGAVMTRTFAVPTSGGGDAQPIIAWDISETTHILDEGFTGRTYAEPAACVLYGQTDRNNDPEAPFEQLQVLSDANADNFATARGTLVTCKPGQWNSRVTAAENVLATVTRAAPGASLRHVVQGFEFTLSGAGNSPQDLTCRIRDGAGGTILWESYIFKDLAGQSVTIRVSDISLPMTANTAMVAEFSAAAGANTFQSINVRGITVD